MRRTVFSETRGELARTLRKCKLLMALVSVAAAVLNVVGLLLRNENNHIPMLILSIAIDIAALWFIIAFHDLKYAPVSIILKLMSEGAEQASVTVKDITHETEMRRGLDCLRVLTDNDGCFYLPELSNVKLECGQNLTIYTVSLIITEVETE